jgi:hypothetical protein
MEVNSYSFGRITISGKMYTSDVIIGRDFVKDGWWRKEGHRVQIDDIREILNYKPETVIFGTGANGRMRVDRKVEDLLREMGIDVIVEETEKAVRTYNRMLKEGKRVVLAAHLTC